MTGSVRAIGLALALAVIVAHAGIVVGDRAWDDAAYHTQVAPPRLAAARAAAAGQWPAWWDGSGLGVPLAGEPSHGAAYPPVWLAQTPRALDGVLLAHVWWAALGVALWARRRASAPGALVAGALVATSGIVVGAGWGGALFAVAHLPWIGVTGDALLAASTRRGKAWAAAGLGVLVAAVALAGQVAGLIAAIGVIGAVCGRRGAWTWAAGGAACGLALGGLQWLPAIAVLRDGAGAGVAAWGWREVLGVVVPSSALVGAGLVALAAVGGVGRRLGAVIGVIVVGGLVAGRGPHALGAPEAWLAAAALIAAASAARGVDAVLAGERRALIALAIGAVATIAAVAARGVLDRACVDGALGAVCLAAAAVVASRVARDAGWRAPVVLALIVAPSLGAVRSSAPTVARAILDEPAWASAAEAAPMPRRVYRPPALPGAGDELVDRVETLAGTVGDRWRLAAARDADPARPPAFDRAWLASAHEGGALLERYAIALAVLPVSLVAHGRFAELARRGGWALVRYPTAPPAAVYTAWEWAGGDDVALARLFPPGGGAAAGAERVVLGGTGMPNQEGAAPAACAIDRWDAGAIDLVCTGEGYAAVSSTAARGWTVTVDGRESAWLTADVLRRAVFVPAGAHHVAWRYRPPNFSAAIVVAALGLLGLGGLIVVGFRGRYSAAQT